MPVITLTGEDGKAVADITSDKEGVYRVTAAVNGTSASKDVTFVQLKDIAVNGYNFALGAGFPKTGFTGAQFTIELTHGNAADYEWTSDASWVSVNDGIVNIKGTATGDKVTISSKPKKGEGVIEYSFEIQKWFMNGGDKKATWVNAKNYCDTNLSGAGLTSSAILSPGQGARGKLGVLYSEWGNMGNYNAAFYGDAGYFTNEIGNDNDYVSVNMFTGFVGLAGMNETRYIVCMKEL